jgi:hypothetical protein
VTGSVFRIATIECEDVDREEAMRIVATSRLAAGAILLAAIACAPGNRTTRSSPRLGASVEVTNTSWYDVVVYSVGSGPRWRLGMVGSLQTHTLRIPSNSLELRLLADPIGSAQVFLSDPIVVSPGQQVELTIAPRLAQSYYTLSW